MEPEPLDGPVNLGLESTTDGPKDSIVWQRGGRGSERSTGTGGANDVLNKEFLRKYIHYARHRVKPVLSEEAMDAISVAYGDMRSKQTPKNLPITARSLETMIRLSSAHAKSRLSDTVNEYDVEEILEIMNYVLFHEIGNYPSPQSATNEPGTSSNEKFLPGKRNRPKSVDPDLMEQDEDGEEVKSDEKRSKIDEDEEEDDDLESYISGSIDRQSPRYRHVQRLILKLGTINGIPYIPSFFATLICSVGGQSLSFDDIFNRLNSDTSEQQKYTKAELKALLRDLETENQVRRALLLLSYSSLAILFIV
jgi:DNA replication licensing factor MCM3